jgi:hypothetical protein
MFFRVMFKPIWRKIGMKIKKYSSTVNVLVLASALFAMTSTAFAEDIMQTVISGRMIGRN